MSLEFIEELDALVPQSRVIATAIGDITVAPLVTAQIPPFLRHARPLFDALEGGLASGPLPDFPVDGIGQLAPDWLTLLETHGEAIIAAVAVATGQPAAAIGRLPPDQTIDLVQAILEENLDFFVRRLLPAVGRLMAGLLGRLSAMAGPTSSSASSPMATGETTS